MNVLNAAVVVVVMVMVVVVFSGDTTMVVKAEVVDANVTAYTCPGDGEYSFQTWTERVIDMSEGSVRFPMDDAELAAVLVAAAEEGKHVRVTGASHSINGLVMNSGDDAIVVSLACYEPPADSGWKMSLDTDTGDVTAPAGYSILVRSSTHVINGDAHVIMMLDTALAHAHTKLLHYVLYACLPDLINQSIMHLS